eukprot:gb/GECH01003934.1/.p1 GENE.gb/GECH01003934.1/~~gb/GECH01003934.1/.p1  ORF type:complete len:436 (+),score=125.64 gb/GECH01003934.1/:1-1308(+)
MKSTTTSFSNRKLSSRDEDEEITSHDPLDHMIEKSPRDETELHMAGIGLKHLSFHFQKFYNLEVLWINNNELKSIENIIDPPENINDKSVEEKNLLRFRGCFKLQNLYAQYNKIITLKGSLKHLKFLKVLLLHHNNLQGLEEVVHSVKHLAFLEQLDLFDNPVAEEKNYRLYTIFHMPQIRILDRIQVTREEREYAKSIYGKAKKKLEYVFGTTIPKTFENDKVSTEIDVIVKEFSKTAEHVRRKKRKKAQEEKDQEIKQHYNEIEKKRSQELPIPKHLKNSKISSSIINKLVSRPSEFIDQPDLNLLQNFCKNPKENQDDMDEWLKNVYGDRIEVGIPSNVSLESLLTKLLINNTEFCCMLQKKYLKESSTNVKENQERAITLSQKAMKLSSLQDEIKQQQKESKKQQKNNHKKEKDVIKLFDYVNKKRIKTGL